MRDAAWGALLAFGDAEPRDYAEEPKGELEDAPIATGTSRSYRTAGPVRAVRELEDRTRHSEESVQAMAEVVAALRWNRADGVVDCYLGHGL